MTTALMLRPEPWAVEDPQLDFYIFMHDMKALKDGFLATEMPQHIDADRTLGPSDWDRECQESRKTESRMNDARTRNGERCPT